MKGIINPLDAIEQNAELVNELIFISEHNYILYLILIERFDIIRELFKDNDIFAKKLALIDQIEKELSDLTSNQQSPRLYQEKYNQAPKSKYPTHP